MMVTAVVEASEETLAFQNIISRLQGKQDGAAAEDRTALYDSVSNWFKENDAGKMTGSEVIEMRPFVSQFSTDIMSDDTTMVQAALQAMGFCLYQAGIVRALTKEDSSMVVKALCNCLLKTDDKSVCTRALWCLAKQNMKADVMEDEVHAILCSVEKALQTEGSAKSMTVQHESVNVIIRLQEQLPDKMGVHAARWGKLLLPHLVHSAPKIRDRAIHGTHLGLVAMVKCRADLAPSLIVELKGGLLTEMMKLFRARHELCVLKVWSYYVTILGKALHKGGSLINNLLAVIEQGFKHPQHEVKKAAYNTWRTLIDNFSLELDMLSNAKRLKLLMQPFLATSIRYESVAHVKLDTWWHLVQALGPRLPATFPVVCVPLLQCTLGTLRLRVSGEVTPIKSASGIPPSVQGFSTPQSRAALLPATSPITPRLNLPPSLGGSASGQQTFPSIQQRGLKMLAAFMGIKLTEKGDSAPIDTLPQRLLSSPSVFSKLAPMLIPFIMDALHMQDDGSGDLPLQIFESLIGQVRGVVEGQSKRDSVAVFTLFMDQLAAVIGASQLPPPTVLKLLDLASQLPKKVLSSSSYHTGDAGILHGTPALFLIDLIFNQTMMLSSPEERFFTILMRLVECGMSSPAMVLGFTQSVMSILDRASESINNKEALWRMWGALAEPLLQHVIQTNEVNQGDSLEHDFSALTVCLLFPIQRLLPHNLSQPTVKTLLKLWSELYEAFARSASLVTIVEANQCCEDVCSKLLMQLGDGDLENWHFQAAIGHMCQIFTQNLDLSACSDAGVGSPTPRRKGKKRSRPEGNLASLVKLVGHVTSSCATLCKKQKTALSPSLGQTDVVHWFNTAQSLIVAMSDLCRVGPTSSLHGILETLSKPLGDFIQYSASPNLAKKDYLTSVEDKIERLWTEWATAIQTRYSDRFDSSFLDVVAPILEATFTYQRRSVRNYTLVFWTATFGMQEMLEYPDYLVPCLAKVRKHSEIVLPGWKETENTQEKSLNLETEASQSQVMPIAAPVIPNFGGPSPQKHYGSFLRRTADAKALMVASSPVKDAVDSPLRGNKALNSPVSGRRKQFASPMGVDVAKRRLPVDEDSKMEFVVISSTSSSKKRVLTEHQKEVMRTKRVSLALYNDLEQSQDTQAFKDLSQAQSQSQQPSPAVSEEKTKDSQTTKFDFSNKIGKEQSTEKAEQGKSNKTNSGKSEPKDKDKSEKVGDESQAKQRKRRVVTLYQPVTKPSSPIKDAGQLAVQEDGSHDSTDELEKVGDSDKIFAASDKEKASDSCVIIEDTCSEGAPEERPSSAILIDETIEDLEIEKEDNFLVPDTQDAFQEDSDIHSVSDDITLISNENGLDTDGAVDLVIRGSPSKDKGQGSTVPQDTAEDLEDVLPDGRFIKVIATPVIKLQKLKQEDINIYSPRVKEKASPEKKGAVIDELSLKEENDARARVLSSPVSSSPTDSTSGTPRFRRYRSDEIHVRSATPEQTRRWNSVSEIAKSESKADTIKTLTEAVDDAETATERRNMKSSQKDLAELAERYELDGIAPLGDLDQSFEEEPSTTDTTDTSGCKDHIKANPPSCSEVLPLLDDKLCGETTKDSEEQEPKKRKGRLRKSEVLKSAAEEVKDSVAVAYTVVEARTDDSPSEVKRKDSEASVEVEKDVLCSQQELFSGSQEDSVMELPVSKNVGTAENTQNDHDEAMESVIASTQEEPRRKRGRPRRNRLEESSDTQKGDNTRKTSSAVQIKKQRRSRPQKSEVGDHAEMTPDDSDSVLDTELCLPGKKYLEHMNERDNQSQNIVKHETNELAVEQETVRTVPESVGNDSCEDMFGTESDSVVVISSEKQVDHVTGSVEVLDKSLGDSFCSEDDVPLVHLKRSVESKNEEEKVVHISDVGLDEHESEDSEIDFPSLTSHCKNDKVSANTDTPPRKAEVTEKPSEREEKHTEIKSPTGKGAEPFIVTRSGRKCRPSAKIRSAKGILKKLLKSPEGKALASELKAKRKSTGAIQKISPKVLRSAIGKSLKDCPQKYKGEGNQLLQNDRQSSQKVQIVDSPVLESCAEDLSSYAISPKSLQTLAEKVATEVSPEVVKEIQTRSAQKLCHTSPETSPVSSSQVTKISKGGRSGKRSKSPVSLRLKARRLCITPGPLQTRAGTRLSRVEIKKKNRRRKQMGSLEEENEEDIINVLENTAEQSGKEEDLKLNSNKTEFESTDVIVINDTMSQDSHQDVEQDTVMEASKYIMLEEAEEDKQATELESKVCEKPCHVAESQIVDDDGDVQMEDLEEEVTSGQKSDKVTVETDHADEKGKEMSKENFVEVKETQDIITDEPVFDKSVVISDTVDVEATQDEPVTIAVASIEDKAERVVVEETHEAGGAVHDIQSETNTKTSQEQVETQIKTRAKRSSQRLTYGEESSNPESAASRVSTEDSRKLADLDKSQKEAEKMENLDNLQKEMENADESDSESSSTDSDDEGTQGEKENIISEKDDVIFGEEGKRQPDQKDQIQNYTVEGSEAAESLTGKTVGIVSSGLDMHGDEDIISSSQSPHKFGTQEGENGEPNSPSKRLNFPNLTPETNAMTSLDDIASETQPFQVSPIIPNKFSSAAQQGSPEGASIRPMWPNQVGSPEGSIPLIYSPNASPSSGILKHNCSSPSPSTKNRRVSFADKVFIEPEPLRDNSSWTKEPSEKKSQDVPVQATDPVRLPLPPSPLVTTASSRVVTKNSKYITTPSKGSPDPLRSSTSSSSSLQKLRKKSPHSSRRMKNKQIKPTFMKSSYASKVFSMAQQASENQRSSPTQSTQGSLTQGSMTSQEESPLEVEGSQGSVYPSLSECSMPVDTVLPRLTSSMWSRGLGQLIRARNIRTIGDLSSLSPMQVKSLPIKSPKISHLKKVLSSFQAEKFPDMKENQSPDISQSAGDASSTTPPHSPSPPTTQESQTSAKSAEAPSPPPSPQHTTGTSLVRRLEALVSEVKEGALDAVPAVELFQAHAHVNNLMDAIVGALKGKCHSPSMGTDAN